MPPVVVPTMLQPLDGATVPICADDETVLPSMNQIARSPEVSCQRMSPRLSPFMSAVPMTVQLRGTLPRLTDDDTVAPFMNQMNMLPLVSRQRRSASPSPSKSRWPTIDQFVGAL